MSPLRRSLNSSMAPFNDPAKYVYIYMSPLRRSSNINIYIYVSFEVKHKCFLGIQNHGSECPKKTMSKNIA